MDEGRAPGSGARSRSRKPTPAERREQRAAVVDLAEVLDSAARFLEARPRSEAEVRSKLTRLGYRSELVEEVLTRLIELHYLDDETFARSWVESRDRARPRGEHALRLELGRKGVDRTTVDAILGERRDLARDAITGDGDVGAGPASADEAAAERLVARKRASLLRELDPRKRLQKTYALLARSGFAPDVCTTVARRLAASVAGPADDDEGGPDDLDDGA